MEQTRTKFVHREPGKSRVYFGSTDFALNSFIFQITNPTPSNGFRFKFPLQQVRSTAAERKAITINPHKLILTTEHHMWPTTQQQEVTYFSSAPLCCRGKEMGTHC